MYYKQKHWTQLTKATLELKEKLEGRNAIQAAKILERHLKFEVGRRRAAEVCKNLGVELGKQRSAESAPRRKASEIAAPAAVVARCLFHLMAKLGEDIPTELVDAMRVLDSIAKKPSRSAGTDETKAGASSNGKATQHA